jgi:YHS domain-containing protein
MQFGNPPAPSATTQFGNPPVPAPTAQYGNSPAMPQIQQSAPPASVPQIVASPAPTHFESNATNSLVKQYDWSQSAAVGTQNTSGVGSAYPPIASPAYATAAPPQSQAPPVSAASFNSVDGQQPLASFVPQGAAPSEFELVAAKNAPPLGLEGYCPVDLMRVKSYGIVDPRDPRFKYTRGDPRYGAVHRGRTYLFSGPAEQQEFLRNPDKYSPAMSGYDPVLYLDEGRKVSGIRKFGLYYGERIYLFASEESQKRFQSDMRRYAEVIHQAENPGRGTLR